MRHAAPALERGALLRRHLKMPPGALVVPTRNLLPSHVDAPEKVDRAAKMADDAGRIEAGAAARALG